MKYIKYIVIVILVFLGTILPGEMYQNYVPTFMSEPNVSFEIPEGVRADVMRSEILDSAKEHNVRMYFVEKKFKNQYYEEIHIYCDESVRKYIKDKYGIMEGTVKSLFSGECKVIFSEWEQLSEDSMQDTPSGYYLLLSLKEAKKFQKTFMQEYSTKSAAILNKNDKTTYIIMLSVFWAVIISIVLLINYYEAVKLQKEIMVRVTMGDSLYIRAVRNILTDLLVYAGIFAVVFLGVRAYACTIFLEEVIIIAGILMTALTALVSCSVLMVNYKKAFANIGVDEKVLKVSYIIKTVTTIVLVFSIAGNVIDSMAYFEALSQKQFYKKYENYQYLDFRATQFDQYEKWAVYSGYFYQKYIEDKDIVACEWITHEPDYNVIMANVNFQWYLEAHIKEFSQIGTEYKKYMLIPEKYRGTALEAKIRESRMYLSDRTGNTKDAVIYYKSNLKIPVKNSYAAHPYTYLTNPVICYSSQTDYSENLEAKKYEMMQVTMPNYFVRISDAEVAALQKELKEYEIAVRAKNVYTVYSYELKILERAFICNLALTLLLLFIELLLVITIIRMEYIANRKEIILKKILGYSLFARFGKLYKITLITGALGICITALIVVKMQLSYSAFIIAVAGLLLTAELAVITILCITSDRANIQRILKNGF